MHPEVRAGETALLASLKGDEEAVRTVGTVNANTITDHPYPGTVLDEAAPSIAAQGQDVGAASPPLLALARDESLSGGSGEVSLHDQEFRQRLLRKVVQELGN